MIATPLGAKENSRPSEPTVAAQSSEAQERVIFQTTTRVWKTNKRRVVPEDAPPSPRQNTLVVISAVGIMDAMTSLVTIPYDIVAAPFRKPRAFDQTTWKVSGRLTDRAGRPRGFVPLTIIVDRLEASREASLGQAASAEARTDGEGRFSAALNGRREKGERAQINVFSQAPDGALLLESRAVAQ